MRKLFAFASCCFFGAAVAYAGFPQADLSITKTDGVVSSTPGGSTTYTIIASNAGPAGVTGAMFGDLLLAPLENCTWTCVGQLGGVCSVPAGSGANANQLVDLPVGGQVVVTATCDIASSATLSFFNTATITQPQGIDDPVGVNNSATDVNGLNPIADLAITKTDGVATFEPGGSTTYTIVASNLGPSDAAGATVTDTFPASLTCNWTCVGSGGGTCTAGGAGNINDVVNLPAGGTATYTANCAIAGGTPSPLVNTASITAPQTIPDPVATNNAATDTNGLSVLAIPTLGDFGLGALALGLGLAAARKLRRRD